MASPQDSKASNASSERTSAHGPDIPDIKEEAQAAAQQLKDKGREKLVQGKAAAADQADAIAGAFDAAAERLSGTSYTLADYAHGLGRNVAGVADRLRNRTVDELVAETEALARRNPTVFVLGSLGLGIVLSRYLKARGVDAQGIARTLRPD
jgi:ABC-type transporter Mla subunit MlaD